MENNENQEFVKMLSESLKSSSANTNQVIQLIISTISRILNLQARVVDKEFELSHLKRGVENSVILKRDMNIQNIILDLLSSPYGNKNAAIEFQHFMYLNKMKIEIKSAEKEITTLNSYSAKHRRVLKTITTDEIFIKCTNFLQYQKVCYMNYWMKRNEAIWKTALEDKEKQAESIDDWINMVSVLTVEQKLDNISINEKIKSMNNLKISKIERVNIPSYGIEIENEVRNNKAINMVDKNIETILDEQRPRDNDVIDVDEFVNVLRNDEIEKLKRNQANEPNESDVRMNIFDTSSDSNLTTEYRFESSSVVANGLTKSDVQRVDIIEDGLYNLNESTGLLELCQEGSMINKEAVEEVCNLNESTGLFGSIGDVNITNVIIEKDEGERLIKGKVDGNCFDDKCKPIRGRGAEGGVNKEKVNRNSGYTNRKPNNSTNKDLSGKGSNRERYSPYKSIDMQSNRSYKENNERLKRVRGRYRNDGNYNNISRGFSRGNYRNYYNER